MKTLFLLVTAVVLFFISGTTFGQTSPYIKIGEAQSKKSLMAFPPIQYVGTTTSAPNFQSVGAEIYNTIFNNLTISSYFQFIDKAAFLEDTTKTAPVPYPQQPNGFKFDSWKQIGADFLTRTSFSILSGEITLDAYVYHVNSNKLILAKKYKGKLSSIRRISHTFSNDLLEALSGNRGMFLSRVVVASDRGGNNFKEIYVMDWDGDNVEKVTNHRTISMSPAWSPDNKKIAYTSFVKRAQSGKRNADLFVYELGSGNRWHTSYKTGINSGAAFHPRTDHIYLTISETSNPDIFQITSKGDVIKKLTNGPSGAMNVEPAISPDGSKIAFSSDRSGQPMIYVMNIDGTGVQRKTLVGKYNSSPAWSPDGKQIAFAGYNNSNFDIFVMDAENPNKILKLTSAKKPNGKWSDNEDPSFSPDGRHIMFTSDRTGKKQIYIINPDGTNERRITSDNANYFKPKWSKNFE